MCAAFLPGVLLVPHRRHTLPQRDAQRRLSRRTPVCQTRPDNDLLKRLSQQPDELEASESQQNQPRGQLFSLFDQLPAELSRSASNFLSNPLHLLAIATLSILFGFFSATSATTIIGSVADWDPLAAAVLLIWTESFTKYYYTRDNPPRVLHLVNAFKIGLFFGMTIDAFKLST